jgi:hypothetical protein
MLTDYFVQPDLRWSHNQLLPGPDGIFRVLDDYLDKDCNSVVLTSTRLRIKNVGMRQGHIEKAEFAPLSVQSLPKIEVMSVDRRPLKWGEEQTIEVRAIMTFDRFPQGERKFAAEVKLLDNLGRQVSRFADQEPIVRFPLEVSFTPPPPLQTVVRCPGR